jgi:phenol 2-monooxygenase
MPHQVILRTADCRPYSTHDLLKSDFRYKLLIFTGDVKGNIQGKMIEKLSDEISQWIVGGSGSSISSTMLQIYTIM